MILFRLRGERRAAVATVADNGVSAGRKLDADLVRPARQRFHGKERNDADSRHFGHRLGAVAQNRLFHPAAYPTNRVNFVFRAIVVKQIAQFAFGFRENARNGGKVFFPEPTGGNESRKPRCFQGRFCVNCHTAHLAVESMDDPRVAVVFGGEEIGKPMSAVRFAHDTRRLTHDPICVVLKQYFQNQRPFFKREIFTMTDLFNEAELHRACGDVPDLSVFACEKCDSTNRQAKEWLAAGNRGAALFASAEQTAGRGRLGRSFYSPAASGVYFSLVYPLQKPLASSVAVTCAAAVAVMRAIRALSGKQTDVKWVNDLLLDGKKVCGILAEAISVGKETSVVVGIGINLRPATFPPELKAIAGSVGDERTPRVDWIAAVARELFPYLREPERRDWLQDYRAHSCVIGHEITFVRGLETVKAKAVGIDDDGGLTVVSEGGTETLRTGEITVRLR